MGTIKSVGRIYQQTFLDTYAKVAFAKLYDRKNALVAADLLNDRVLPFLEEHEIPLLRVLTDRGTEYCGQREHHEYELYLAVENIDHSRPKLAIRKPTASANAFIAPFRKSFTPRRSARSCTRAWRNCRRTWTRGWRNTIEHAHIRANTATAKRRCKLSWIRSR